jgi:hypothetical protein
VLWRLFDVAADGDGQFASSVQAEFELSPARRGNYFLRNQIPRSVATTGTMPAERLDCQEFTDKIRVYSAT